MTATDVFLICANVWIAASFCVEPDWIKRFCLVIGAVHLIAATLVLVFGL